MKLIRIHIGWQVSALIILQLANIGVAYALEFDYGLGYRAEYSNNIYLTSEPLTEEITHIGDLSLEVIEDGPEFSLQARASASSYVYSEDSYEDNQYYSLYSSAFWQITPQQFSWSLQDFFSQVHILSTDPDIPDNQQDSNAFITGPNFIVRFNSLTRLELGMRYADYYYEITDVDSKRYLGTARLERDNSSYLRTSINYEALDVKYDVEESNTNYFRNDLFIRGIWSPISTTVTMDLGMTIITFDENDNIRDELIRLRIERDMTSHSRVVLAYISEYSDAGRELESISVQNSRHTFGGEIGSGDIFKLRRAELNYTNIENANTFRIGVYGEELTYHVDPLDRETKGANVEMTYAISPTTAIFGSYVVTDSQYFDSGGEVGREDRERTRAVRLEYSVTRNTSMYIEGRINNRHSNNHALSYEEKVGIISLRYNR